MSVPHQIRRFPFFEFKEVVEKATKTGFSLLKGINLACISCGRGYIVVGDSKGMIYMINKFLNSFYLKFNAFDSCLNNLIVSKKSPFIYSVGTDFDDGTYLKIWDINKFDNFGVPLCLKRYQILKLNDSSLVSCFNVLESLNYFVFGFTCGTIKILEGSVNSKKKQWNSSLLKSFTIPITNLEFLVTGDRARLFITTLENISFIDFQSFPLEVKNIENFGCNPNCCSSLNTSFTCETFVSSENAIHSFNNEGRAQCFPIEGNKGILRIYKNNIIYTIKNIKYPRIFDDKSFDPNLSILNIITLEEKTKYISFTKSIADIFDVIYVWNSLFVVTTTGQLFEIIECPLERKIDILFSVNMYDLAISLARRTLNANLLNTVICKYGDNLYSKGNVEEAMNQYITTIGILEPSYVIRKYLDAQNIKYLTSYLECLHKKELASSDHTTLLLNCYIRLKDVEKLDLFLKRENDYHFDVETALYVCRQAGFYNHALHLAKKSQSHEWYLKIQLEDVQDYKSALDYIRNLDVKDAEKILTNYGRRLLTSCPLALVDFLKYICTFSERNVTPCNAENFIHIFVDQREYLQPFLEYIIIIKPDSSKLVYNTLIEIYLYELTNSNAITKNTSDIEAKCLKILELDKGKYDDDHALMLCQLNHFVKGLVFLYEKTQKYNLILQYHFSIKDFGAILKDCKKYGDVDLSLWSRSLQFLAMNMEICGDHLAEMISYIEENDVIPPISVISSLSKSPNCSISVIKEMMSNRLEKSTISSKEEHDQVLNMQRNIEEVDNSINLIKSGKKPIHNSKCTSCSKPLELPVVHFLCGHSYHKNCIDVYDQGTSCIQCFSQIQSLRRNFLPVKDMKVLVKSFERDVMNSSNPINSIHKYLKYGLFDSKIS